MSSVSRILTTSALLAATICPGCSGYHRPPATLPSAALVGTYVYVSAGGPPIHSADRLTLRADGTYVLVRMSGGHPGPTERGEWEFFGSPPWGGGPQVEFGRGSYPVEVSGKEIRLLINLDVGHWYQKTG